MAGLSAIFGLVLITAFMAGSAATASVSGAGAAAANEKVVDKAVFFAADGMRQDIVARYSAQGLLPTMSGFLKNGTSASGNGLLTQAPPNTGAGWYSLATGAWPGVHGSTNNTFHINGQRSTLGRRRSMPNVLQAESIAQSAERGGLKVAQVEWAGGRNATIKGPTIDFQSFFSGRGVATNFIGQSGDVLFDHAANIRGVRAPVRPPARIPRPTLAVPRRGADGGDRLDGVPQSFSPPMEMRLRVLDFGIDKYGLNAYIFDSTEQRPRRATTGCSSPGRRAEPPTRSPPREGSDRRREGDDQGRRSAARRQACSSRSRC